MDRNAPDLRALRVLLHDKAWSRFEAAIEGAERVGLESEGIHHYIRTHHLSESDRLLLTLAYSLWRGFGPSVVRGVDIHALWGMDPTVAARMLAGLAAAIDPAGATDILKQSIEMLDEDEQPDEHHDAPTDDATLRPKLAMAHE
jgi:hypothetical protein